MSDMKCPFCNSELDMDMCGECGCPNEQCQKSVFMFGSEELWQELIRTRKALDYAIDVIQKVAKMSDKLSREYGETLVEQLDNIQAYCWQEGYVLTHEEDLSKALTKGGDNE